jgi:hypothetical protein
MAIYVEIFGARQFETYRVTSCHIMLRHTHGRISRLLGQQLAHAALTRARTAGSRALVRVTHIKPQLPLVPAFFYTADSRHRDAGHTAKVILHF